MRSTESFLDLMEVVGVMGIWPGRKFSTYHNSCGGKTLVQCQRDLQLQVEFQNRNDSPIGHRQISCCQVSLVIGNVISKNDNRVSTRSEPNWRAASSTVDLLKLSPRPVEPAFFHQRHLDLTGLSPNSPFCPIIHDRGWGHYGIKGNAWNPKEAITLGFNCISSKCQSTPDVWESSASL